MIFLLPIYKESRASFLQWLEIEKSKAMENAGNESGISIEGTEVARATEEQFEEKYQPSWEQNQAVGWVEVHKCVGGLSFRISKATTMKMKVPNRYFTPIGLEEWPNGGKVISFSSCITELDFLQRFENIINGIVSDGRFNKHIIDWSQVKELSPHINWSSLIS